MIKTFTDIYDKKKWGGGSGVGSSIKYNAKFIPFLQKLVDNSNTILDLGCGDFNYTTQIDFTNKKYIGLDCVESVINKNNIEFSNSNISFECCDIFDYNISNRIIVKDNHRPCIPKPIDPEPALPKGGNLPCVPTGPTCSANTDPPYVHWRKCSEIKNY